MAVQHHTLFVWLIENFDAVTKTQKQATIHLGVISGPKKVSHHCYNEFEVDTLMELWTGIEAVDQSRVGLTEMNPTGKFLLRGMCIGTMQDYPGMMATYVLVVI